MRVRLRDEGARPAHERRVLVNWLAGRELGARASRSDAELPAQLLRTLPRIAAELDALARVESSEPGSDGSERLLVRLADGRSIESVRLPSRSLCASTQVGCAVGCTFCMTGRTGLVRQMTSVEIAAQLALARRRGPVARVVLMGMGEPAHNLDSVLAAVEALNELGGLSRKDIVISTVGDRRLFERLATSRIQPALAVSLHTTDARKRRELLPRAPAIEPAELIELAETYARASGIPIQYQWTLLAGVNDGDDELAGLQSLLAGRYGIVNFIPWNAVEGLEHARPSLARQRTLVQRLHQGGILAKLRRSAGQDVEGACGQLRARALARVEGA